MDATLKTEAKASGVFTCMGCDGEGACEISQAKSLAINQLAEISQLKFLNFKAQLNAATAESGLEFEHSMSESSQ